MRLRAAFFDVGGTLIGWSSGDDPWRPVVMKAIEREFGSRSWAEALYAADIRRPPADDPYRQETNRWLAEWLTSNAETLTDSEVERLRMAFAAPLDRGLELLPGAADALRWCKCQRLATVLVTNTISRGDDEVRRDWERFGLSDVIDHVVSSHSTGWMKPHPAMYRRALAPFSALAEGRVQRVWARIACRSRSRQRCCWVSVVTG